jgi:hypothetical protein
MKAEGTVGAPTCYNYVYMNKTIRFKKDLVKYLANRERDRERSQSNPLRKRNNLEWCRQREDLDQEYIHNVLRTGLLKEGGGDGVPFTASPAVGIKNVMLC